MFDHLYDDHLDLVCPSGVVKSCLSEFAQAESSGISAYLPTAVFVWRCALPPGRSGNSGASSCCPIVPVSTLKYMLLNLTNLLWVCWRRLIRVRVIGCVIQLTSLFIDSKGFSAPHSSGQVCLLPKGCSDTLRLWYLVELYDSKRENALIASSSSPVLSVPIFTNFYSFLNLFHVRHCIPLYTSPKGEY